MNMTWLKWECFVPLDFVLIMYCGYLLRQLFLTQFVQGIKLAAEDLIFTKTCAGKFHSHDDGSVRHHHGHRAELNFQILRQLLTTSITWVLWWKLQINGGEKHWRKSMNENSILYIKYMFPFDDCKWITWSTKWANICHFTIVRKMPNSLSISTTSPSVNMNWGFLFFLHCRTM